MTQRKNISHLFTKERGTYQRKREVKNRARRFVLSDVSTVISSKIYKIMNINYSDLFTICTLCKDRCQYSSCLPSHVTNKRSDFVY
jgi:hypothetical protein